MIEKDEFINKKFVCEPIQDLEGGKVDSVTFTMDIETWNKLKAQILKENPNPNPLAGLSDTRLEIIIDLRKKPKKHNTLQEYFFAEEAKKEQKRRKQLSKREKEVKK